MEKETIFDNKVFRDFLNYLDNATPEQLEEDLKQIEQYNKYGPLMGDLVKEALNKLDKNKEQDTIKFPEMYPLMVYPNPYTNNPNIHIVPDGHGGFKYKPDYTVTSTISTSSLKPKEQ